MRRSKLLHELANSQKKPHLEFDERFQYEKWRLMRMQRAMQTNESKMQCARGVQRFPQESSFTFCGTQLQIELSRFDSLFDCFFFLLWFIHSSQFTHYYLRSLSSTIITVIWCLFGFPPVVLLLHYKNATRIR